jgi:hypothetical protein
LPTELPNVKKPHANGESLVLPACADIVKTTLGESYSKELQKLSPTDNTVTYLLRGAEYYLKS